MRDPQKFQTYNRAYQKEWRKTHPEEHRKNNQKYYQDHKEAINARQVLRQQTKPEQHSACVCRYFKRHPEMSRLAVQKRRARKLRVGGELTPQEWFLLCFAVGFKCLCCGKQKPLTIDHVIPLSKGGSNNLFNVQPLCKSCNSKKQVKCTDFRW